LLNISVSVSTVKELKTREVPNIITVITQEDIKNIGANDLMDVLKLVPGVSFGLDVESSIGISMRGLWGHEGKVLILVDGQEMNEGLFACFNYSQHIPVELIKKIEIIRGPGSSIYGGYAELGVINIITKDGNDYTGLQMGTTYGQMANNFGHANAYFNYGMKNDKTKFRLSGFYGEGNRSDKEKLEVYGKDYYFNKTDFLAKQLFINTGFEHKNLKARFVIDDYKNNSYMIFNNDVKYNGSYNSNYLTLAGEVKYDFKINDKLKITPKINFKHQNPWKADYYINDSSYYDFNVNYQKALANIMCNYDMNENINILGGVEYYLDYSKYLTKGDEYIFYNGKDNISFNNISQFAQLLMKTRIVNITLGERIDKHNMYGTSFAPRIGLTKVVDKFHAKALFSKAFRAPSVYNIDYNQDIVPENTYVAELELGYQFNKKMMFKANLFEITIDDPIIYTAVFENYEYTEQYINSNKTGSRGIEVEYKYIDNKINLSLGYSYSTTQDKNEVIEYRVPVNGTVLLGAPKHKFIANFGIKISKNINANTTYVFNDKRYGYNGINSNGNSILKEFDQMHDVSLYLAYDNLFNKNINIGIGVRNLFDDQSLYLQPYDGGLTGYPMMSREYFVKLSYSITKK